jgi:hypothetical protein
LRYLLINIIVCDSRGRNAPYHPSDKRRGALRVSPNSVALVAQLTSLPLGTEGLLLYFANAVLPRFQLMEETLPLDLEAVMHDHPLQQAILAVAQAHYDTFSHATSNNSILSRRRARHSAIHILRERLELGSDAATTAQQLFPVNVLLCMLDGMIEPREQENASVYHLKGGYALIQGSSNLPANMLKSGGLHAHLLSVFATIDLVHALLSGDKPYFDPFIWFMFSDTPVWFGRLDRNDRFLALLKTFSEMASLGHTVASQLPSDDGLRLVEKCIPSIEAAFALQAQSEKSPTTNPAIPPDHWRRFCVLYELSATIYMHRALRNCSIDDEPVQVATRKGVENLVDGALPGMLAHCVIFPILVIGAHCMHTQDRRAILEAISPSKDYLSFGNLQIMTELLQNMWSKPGLDMQANWWECFQPVAEKVFLF